MDELETEYRTLQEEILVASLCNGEPAVNEFYRLFSEIAAENGDCPDLEHYPVYRDGPGGYRIDGMALEELEDGSISGDLCLVICDYRQDQQIQVMNSMAVDDAVDRALKFFGAMQRDSIFNQLEESSPAFQAGLQLRTYAARITRIRVLVLTNAVLKTRKRTFSSRDLGDVKVNVNVLDLVRYSQIASAGGEAIEIDLTETPGGSVPCLPAHVRAAEHQSYLMVFPGETLASIFAEYGNRLLEQNVRSYLQARTSVNKGILNTIRTEPSMFFSYNNGLTATASAVDICTLPGGQQGISRISNLQIVNGGQTTASLLYARDTQKRDLNKVFVQVKLSVIPHEVALDVVPKISEYANTQNKVQIADLAANSPAQIAIKRLFDDTSVPVRAGQQLPVHWFYERARGQYRSLTAGKKPSEQKALLQKYPRSHLILKTDLAKYEFSFDGEPWVTCLGAQKAFGRYTDKLKAIQDKDLGLLNRTWYKRAIAKALLFNALDSAVQNSDWYKEQRGYKAQIVAYALALAAAHFRARGQEIALDRIWAEQEAPKRLVNWMLVLSEKVKDVLRSPPSNVRSGNVSEFAKARFCWTQYILPCVGPIPHDLEAWGMSDQEFRENERSGLKENRFDDALNFEIALTKLGPRVEEIRLRAQEKQLFTLSNQSAINKLARGNFALTKGEQKAFKDLLSRIDFDLSEVISRP